MSLGIVQSVINPAGSVASFTLTFASTPATGNAVIVGATGDAQAISSVVDNQGNTFLDAVNTTSTGSDIIALWYFPSLGAVTPPYTVTVTLAAASFACGSMHEVSGTVTSSPLDVTLGKFENDGSATPSIGPTAGTAQASEIVFAAIASANSGLGPLAIAATWGSNASTYSADATMNYSMDYRIATAVETETPQWTAASGGAAFGMVVASFKAAGGATYSESVSEAGAASDVPSTVLVLATVDAENGSAQDSLNGIMTFAVQGSENGAAADVPSVVVIAQVNATEAGVAADTPNASMAYSVYVSEAGVATDVESAIATFAAAMAENGAAADVPSATAMLLAAIVEIGTAADTTVIFSAVVLTGNMKFYIAAAPARSIQYGAARAIQAIKRNWTVKK